MWLSQKTCYQKLSFRPELLWWWTWSTWFQNLKVLRVWSKTYQCKYHCLLEKQPHFATPSHYTTSILSWSFSLLLASVAYSTNWHLPRGSQHEWPKPCLAVAPSVQSLCFSPASQSLSPLWLESKKTPLFDSSAAFLPEPVNAELQQTFLPLA